MSTGHAVDFEEDEKDAQEMGRQLKESRRRVEQSRLSEMPWDYAIASHRWLEKHKQYEEHDDHVVRESFHVLSWDSHLIGAKLHRALTGQDEDVHDILTQDDPVQNDWNGSAKVALLSIERSRSAWQKLHAAVGDDGSKVLGDSLDALAAAVRAQFPDVMSFRRPGFDGPG